MGAFLVRSGGGLIIASSTVMLADVVDYSEYKFGTRNESIIFSCQTLLVKSAGALSGWLIGIGLAAFGYVANAEQSTTTMMGMRGLMFVLPTIFIALCFVVYKKYYKLTGDYHEEIIKELEVRHTTKASNETVTNGKVAPELSYE